MKKLLFVAVALLAVGCSSNSAEKVEDRRTALVTASQMEKEEGQVQQPRKKWLHEDELATKGIYRNDKGYYDLSTDDLKKATGIK